MLRSRARIATGLAVALSTLAVSPFAAAQQAVLDRIKRSGTITVCADPDRMPYSSEKLDPAGYDLEISQAIAKELGFKLGYTWHSTHRGTKIVRQLAEGACDFFPGFPVDASFEESNFKVILTKPYYSSGFATIARADAPDTILADSKKKGVGVQMGTLPDFKLFDRGYERKLFRNTHEMYEALVAKEIDAAVVPATEGGWELKEKGDNKVKVLANTEKDFVFPMAIGVAKGNTELRDLLNGAIDKVEASGKMSEIFNKYGVVKLAGTGGGEAPKPKAQDDDKDGPPAGDKKAEAAPAASAPAAEKKAEAAPAAAPAATEKKAEAPAAEAAKPAGEIVPETGEDLGADSHGLALSPAWRVDTRTVEDFPNDEKSIDQGRKLYKQACYKCHGPNGVSGGTIPDLRLFAAKADHYEMFAVIQAGRPEKQMPAWNDYLTPEEIKQVIVYVKALHKK